MGGLIPLMLASSGRTSVACTSPTSSQRQAININSPDTLSPTSPTSPTSPPTSPTSPAQAATLTLHKRPSRPHPVSLPAVPCTRTEWKHTIAEVKRKYFGKRYRACSARCLEVLDGVKDTSQVEPVYLIYLHFYAATSMEICARPLPPASPLRASLLQQARTHFDRASALISSAEESVLRRFRPGSVTSSHGSSCYSPCGSVASGAWTPDTRVSSPTESVYSFEDVPLRSAAAAHPPPKRVKKVSFSLPGEASPSASSSSCPLPAAEPVIRPDSPTLGFDNDYYYPVSPARQESPPDDPHTPPKFHHHEIELPPRTIPETETEAAVPQPADGPDGPEDQVEDDDAYALARSVSVSADRCCEHLADLRAQLARHAAALDRLLLLPSASQPGPTGLRGGVRNAEDARALDRQARIERLRRTGWRRKRFDASRYEVLCEAVLAEMA